LPKRSGVALMCLPFLIELLKKKPRNSGAFS